MSSPQTVSLLGGKLYYSGHEMTKVERVLIVTEEENGENRIKGVFGRGKVPGRDEKLMFFLEARTAAQVFNQYSIDAGITETDLLSKLLHEFDYFPTDSFKATKIALDFIERTVKQTAKNLRENAEYVFERYTKTLFY